MKKVNLVFYIAVFITLITASQQLSSSNSEVYSNLYFEKHPDTVEENEFSKDLESKYIHHKNSLLHKKKNSNRFLTDLDIERSKIHSPPDKPPRA
jgi:hypothetical protein